MQCILQNSDIKKNVASITVTATTTASLAAATTSIISPPNANPMPSKESVTATVTLSEKDIDAKILQGVELYRNKQYSLSRMHFENLFKYADNKPDILFYLGLSEIHDRTKAFQPANARFHHANNRFLVAMAKLESKTYLNITEKSQIVKAFCLLTFDESKNMKSAPKVNLLSAIANFEVNSQFSQAIPLYQKYFQLNPLQISVHYRYRYALLRLYGHEDKRVKDAFHLWAWLMVLDVLKKSFDLAISAYEDLISRNPSHILNRIALLEHYYLFKQYSQMQPALTAQCILHSQAALNLIGELNNISNNELKQAITKLNKFEQNYLQKLIGRKSRKYFEDKIKTKNEKIEKPKTALQKVDETLQLDQKAAEAAKLFAEEKVRKEVEEKARQAALKRQAEEAKKEKLMREAEEKVIKAAAKLQREAAEKERKAAAKLTRDTEQKAKEEALKKEAEKLAAEAAARMKAREAFIAERKTRREKQRKQQRKQIVDEKNKAVVKDLLGNLVAHVFKNVIPKRDAEIKADVASLLNILLTNIEVRDNAEKQCIAEAERQRKLALEKADLATAAEKERLAKIEAEKRLAIANAEKERIAKEVMPQLFPKPLPLFADPSRLPAHSPEYSNLCFQQQTMQQPSPAPQQQTTAEFITTATPLPCFIGRDGNLYLIPNQQIMIPQAKTVPTPTPVLAQPTQLYSVLPCKMPETVKSIIQELRENLPRQTGSQGVSETYVFLFGGSVLDLVLGNSEIYDFDIAVTQPRAIIAEYLIKRYNLVAQSQNIFLNDTITLYLSPNRNSLCKLTVKHAIKDVKFDISSIPTTNQFHETNCHFSVAAMTMTDDDFVHSSVGCFEDIRDKRIRAINGKQAYANDPSLILHAVRYESKLLELAEKKQMKTWHISANDLVAIKENIPKLKNLSQTNPVHSMIVTLLKERIFQRNGQRNFSYLLELGVIEALFGEIPEKSLAWIRKMIAQDAKNPQSLIPAAILVAIACDDEEPLSYNQISQVFGFLIRKNSYFNAMFSTDRTLLIEAFNLRDNVKAHQKNKPKIAADLKASAATSKVEQHQTAAAQTEVTVHSAPVQPPKGSSEGPRVKSR